jgi:hypothetical protein
VYVGRACPDGNAELGSGVPGGDPLLADPAGKLALVDRGACNFVAKLPPLAQAGAIGVVMVNNQDGAPFPMGAPAGSPSVGLASVMVGSADGTRLKAALAAGVPLEMTLSADIVHQYNDWGGLRLIDISDPAHPRQVGRFGTAHSFTDRVHGPPDAGKYAVHNPIVDGNLVFASWYSDGVRAVDIRDPARPREVGYFVPPHSPAISPRDEPDGAVVWGVVKHGDLLILSDMNFGLWIVRHRPS